MFQGKTYEALMKRVMDRVPSTVDKGEGSILFDAISPAIIEMTQMYLELDKILAITFAGTSYDEYLTWRAAEMGVHRAPATNALRYGTFYNNESGLMDVPSGSRFSLNDLNFTVEDRLSLGRYLLRCEQAGVIGNTQYGHLTPIDFIFGLSTAVLEPVAAIPAEEEETDTHLYARYEEAVNEQPFGGNIADYKRKIRAIEGVGDCKIYPVRRGGGTVDAVIIASDFTPPSETLVKDVQEALDPEPYHQRGKGLAPIGHWVDVAGVEAVPVNIATRLQLKSGVTVGQVEEDIHEAMQAYFRGLAEAWAKDEPPDGWTQTDGLIVRLSQIDARILTVSGVTDVSGTTVNGSAVNLTLGADAIPVFGGILFL